MLLVAVVKACSRGQLYLPSLFVVVGCSCKSLFEVRYTYVYVFTFVVVADVVIVVDVVVVLDVVVVVIACSRGKLYLPSLFVVVVSSC